MSTLKTLFMLVVLGGLCYGVYTVLYTAPTVDQGTDAPAWGGPPRVEAGSPANNSSFGQFGPSSTMPGNPINGGPTPGSPGGPTMSAPQSPAANGLASLDASVRGTSAATPMGTSSFGPLGGSGYSYPGAPQNSAAGVNGSASATNSTGSGFSNASGPAGPSASLLPNASLPATGSLLPSAAVPSTTASNSGFPSGASGASGINPASSADPLRAAAPANGIQAVDPSTLNPVNPAVSNPASATVYPSSMTPGSAPLASSPAQLASGIPDASRSPLGAPANSIPGGAVGVGASGATGAAIGVGPAGAPVTAAPPGIGATTMDMAPIMATIQGLLNAGKLAEALSQLTMWYDNPQVAPADQKRINELLDQVAGTVIYSNKCHLLMAPYTVRPNERLQTIAAQYNVPWQLLANINGIKDPDHLLAGDTLKVVRGPFSALVSLDKRYLTLMVQGCYAGKFPLESLGDTSSVIGSYEVRGKQTDRGEFSGQPEGPADPRSAPGKFALMLSDRVSIQSSAVGPATSSTMQNDPIRLSSRDAEDVFNILTVGSKVVIRR